MEPELRLRIAMIMADEYKDFKDFAEEALRYLGFDITAMQSDIAEFMQSGPRLRMVMAQRGEAKSTLAALYAVWRLVRDPKTRVLIISAGEDKASEVAAVVIKLIMHWEKLDYLRPERRMGDRTGSDAFDVNYVLKGIDQSPSVACIGITGNLQGRRADLLIPDDIESTKNGLTVGQRQILLALTREFTSINTHGDILYLGTPQTKDSIYNTLPNRGFEVRIWPGRFPNPEERERYGSLLAPYVADKLDADPSLGSGHGLDGTRGAPTDPGRFDDKALIEKELDQGPEGFQLQYMLDTSLADALRQQLKLSDLLCADFNPDRVPEVLVHRDVRELRVDLPPQFPVTGAVMYRPVPDVKCDWVELPKDRIMTIDPAGGGGDEIGYATGCAVGPYIHALDVGGIMGGLTEENGERLVEIIRRDKISHVIVESNMGHGLFEINLRAILAKHEDLKNVGVAGQYSTGQKERRIIDSLVSAMQRHRVILHKQVFESDAKWNQQHTIDKRKERSLFYQIENITTDRQSLPKDDRIEALAMLVRHYKAMLALDEDKAAEARRKAEAEAWMSNPMGYDDPAWNKQHTQRKGTAARLGRIPNIKRKRP